MTKRSDIKVKITKIINDNTKLRAVADVVIDDNFVVHGIKIIVSSFGELIVCMPYKKICKNRHDIFHCINNKTRKELIEKVLAAYKEREN